MRISIKDATKYPSRQRVDIEVRWKEQTVNKGTLQNCIKFLLNYIEKVPERYLWKTFSDIIDYAVLLFQGVAIKW